MREERRENCLPEGQPSVLMSVCVVTQCKHRRIVVDDSVHTALLSALKADSLRALLSHVVLNE